jgi:protein-S-isoprenylcysteine O-methyltransferase Ste14
MIVGALALRAAPAPHEWPLFARALFAVGGISTVVSLASLGRSFAVLPSLRSVVDRGPYRFVRHPAYAAELTMVAACVIARADAIGAALFLGALVTGIARILVEERLLGRDEAYGAYAQRVRFRLVPGVW